MTKIEIKKIFRCNDCSHFGISKHDGIMCHKTNRKIVEEPVGTQVSPVLPIPDWCPLADEVTINDIFTSYINR